MLSLQYCELLAKSQVLKQESATSAEETQNCAYE
jgi:hypothetical protein